ncbi:unnamed protein product, partial [Linum trigynum]
VTCSRRRKDRSARLSSVFTIAAAISFSPFVRCSSESKSICLRRQSPTAICHRFPAATDLCCGQQATVPPIVITIPVDMCYCCCLVG